MSAGIPTELRAIFARAGNGVMGRGNQLPWDLPEDLAHFKRMTQSCPVIMGRKTWESLPGYVRPLPGRLNVVVTRNPEWVSSGALRAASLHQAIDLCQGYPVSWVIGGSQLLLEAMPLAQRLVVTEIEANYAGDVYAPEIAKPWRIQEQQEYMSSRGLGYRIVVWQRDRVLSAQP